MLKSIMKGVMSAALLCGMVVTAWADEIPGKVNGRARTTFVYGSVKDGASVMDIGADGRLGYEMSTSEGDWKATGYVQLGLGSDQSISLRDAKVTLENPTIAITAGRQYPWGVTSGGAYLTDNIGDIYWAGEYATKNTRDSFLNFGLKNIGLNLIVGINPQTEDNVGVYNETVVAGIYSISLNPLSINASYVSVSGAIDEKQAGTANKNSAVDGLSQSSLAVGIGYNINEQMGVSLNIDMLSTEKGGSPAPDEVKDQYMVLIFDMGLSASMGISLAYNTNTQDDGTSAMLQQTALVVGCNLKLAGTDIFVQYFSETAKDDDTALDSASSKVGAGLTYGF